MNWPRPTFLGRIDYKRITPEQRTRLEPFLIETEVQDRLWALLRDVTGTIDIMSTRVRSCLSARGQEGFDAIVSEREQKRLLVEKLRNRKGKSWNWNKMARR